MGEEGAKPGATFKFVARFVALAGIFVGIYFVAPEDRRWKIMEVAAIVSAIALVLGFVMFLLLKQMQKQKRP